MDATPATRRQLLTAPACALLIGAVPLASDAPTEPDDRELMEACADFENRRRAVSAAVAATAHLVCAGAEAEAAICNLMDDEAKAMDRVAGLPARSLAGLQAKARVVVAFHVKAGDYGDTVAHRRLEWSVFAQLAGVSP